MSFNIFSGKETFNVVWTVPTCVKRRILESNVFKMEDCEWSLLLQVEVASKGDQDWQLHINKVRPVEGLHILVMGISIEDKRGFVQCLNYAKATMTQPTSQRILWRSRLQVLEHYPHVVLGEDVTFIVTFLSDYRNISDLMNKEVNRSSQSPPYMDVHPCLDSLMSNFKKMFEDGLYTDIELQCDKHTFNAHKAVLTARSEVFAAMLNNDMLEKQKSSIEIVDMSHQTMEEFLKYLYTGTLPEMNMDIATRLYEAGDKYAIETLKARCTHFFREHLDEANACMLFALSDAHSDEYLKEFVVSYMVRKNMLEAIKTQIKQEYPHLAFDKICQAYRTAEPYSLKK